MFEVPVFAQKRNSLLGLVVAHSLGLVQSVGQAGPGLHQEAGVVLQLLQLPQSVRILSSHPALTGLQVTEVQVGLLDLLVEVVESIQQVLVGFLSRGLGPVDLVSGGPNISDLRHDLVLVLLHLALHLAQLLNLLVHLHNGIWRSGVCEGTHLID